MKQLILAATAVLLGHGHVLAQNSRMAEGSGMLVQSVSAEMTRFGDVTVVIETADALVMVDPVGAQADLLRFGRPDIVVLTSPEPSHLGIETMIGLLRRDTVVLAPGSVIDRLPLMLSNNTFAPFDIGTTQSVGGLTFSAVPIDTIAPTGAFVAERDRGQIGVIMEMSEASWSF